MSQPRVVAWRDRFRWSTLAMGAVAQVAGLAAPMAGMLASRAMVLVGPPLLATVASPGLATPTMSPSVALASSLQPAPFPIRLWPPGPLTIVGVAPPL